MLAKMEMFSDPVALRVPRQTLRKITSSRRARSAWLLVGGPPKRTKAKTSPCSRAPGEEPLAQGLGLGELQWMGADPVEDAKKAGLELRTPSDPGPSAAWEPMYEKGISCYQ